MSRECSNPLPFVIIALGLASGCSAAPPPSEAPHPPTLQQRCADGDAIACNDQGVLVHGSTDPTIEETNPVSWFRLACEGGSPDGCSNLGAMYESGSGVAQSAEVAAELYAMACSAGVGLGCSNLGALYVTGKVVRTDADPASLFERACALGANIGCSNARTLSRQRARPAGGRS